MTTTHTFYDGETLMTLKPTGESLWEAYEAWQAFDGEILEEHFVSECEGETPAEAEADFFERMNYVHQDDSERITPREPYSGSYREWE